IHSSLFSSSLMVVSSSLVRSAMRVFSSTMRGPTQPPGHRLLPLKGVTVLELGGLAPVPHCGMMLADFGADVTVLEKGGEIVEQRLNRGKKMVEVDLKSADGVNSVRDMCRTADVLLDPYRPGVLEKLGLDPLQLLQDNPGLIVCRLTGFGQAGPLSQEAGHDINYTAISGYLPTIAGTRKQPPWPPVNLLSDFAGGGLTAAFGIVAALFQRTTNGGKGAVLDVSMTEGLAYLSTFISMYKSIDYLWTVPFAAFGSECPIYRCYETKDGKYMSVGCLEPKFTHNMLEVTGLTRFSVPEVHQNPAEVVKALEEVFKQKTRDEWAKIFEGKDACVAPVLDMDEVGDYPHHRERGAFVRDEEGHRWIPRPHPRIYSREELLKSKI
ncbi:hypothetical protein PENTCL1PPCAC_27595, partial [Pristionchus entomophagus]